MKTGLLPKATALMSDGEVSTTDERVRRHVEVLRAELSLSDTPATSHFS